MSLCVCVVWSKANAQSVADICQAPAYLLLVQDSQVVTLFSPYLSYFTNIRHSFILLLVWCYLRVQQVFWGWQSFLKSFQNSRIVNSFTEWFRDAKCLVINSPPTAIPWLWRWSLYYTTRSLRPHGFRIIPTMHLQQACGSSNLYLVVKGELVVSRMSIRLLTFL